MLLLAPSAGAQAPETVELRNALKAMTRELLPACGQGRRAGVLVPEQAGEPERYAAAVLAFFLREGGADACVGRAAAVPEELPPQLGPGMLTAVEPPGVNVAVLVKLTGKDPPYRLSAAVYLLTHGGMLAAGGTMVQLGEDLAFLPEARLAPLSHEDGNWLALFARILGPCPPAEGKPEERLAAAAGAHFFERGFWPQAALALGRAGRDGPNLCLVRAVMALHNAGDSDQALEKAEAALKLHPDSGPLYALKAWLLLRRDARDDVLIFLEQARLSDVAREGYYWIARHLAALECGEKESADLSVRKAAELLPEEPIAQLAAARFFWREARLGKAVEFYEAALRAGASGTEVWVQFGMALDASGQPERALDAFRHAFELNPGNPRVARHLSSLLKSAGHSDEALRVLQRASDARPDRLELLAVYADTAAETWHTQQAEAAYAQALQRDPSFLHGKAGLARMLTRQRRYAEAEQILHELLESNPHYQPGRLALASLLVQQGSTEHAIAALQEAARSPESEPASRMALSEIYSRTDQHDEAIRNAQIAVAARPDSQTYAALARAFIEARELEKADLTVQMSLEAGPMVAAAHLVAAELAAAGGQYEQAQAAAAKATALDPNSPRALTLAGELSLRLDRPEECAELWASAAELNPWDAELHWNLAEALRTRLGRPAEAIQHYRRHVELGGSHAGKAERLLRELGGAVRESEAQPQDAP